MAKPRIIYKNLWRKGTALASSPVANPQHPVSDTQIDTLSMFFRASAATTPCTIPIDQGTTPGAIDFVAILAHNIDDDATITLEGADNEAFTTGFVSRTLNHNVANIFEFVATFTKKYVRLKLVSGNGNFDAAPQVATILCGSYFELNRTVGLGYEEGSEDFSEVEYSDAHVLFAQEKEIIDVKTLPFRGLDNATRENILFLFKEVGIHKAYIICFDSSDANNESHWIVNAELTNPKYEQADCWTWELRLREIK